MQKVNLNDVIGRVDDQLLEKALETDSTSKLMELKKMAKKKERSRLFQYISLFSSCLAIFILGMTWYQNHLPSSNNEVLVPNPLIDVSNLNDLSTYLGLNVTNMDFKTIENINTFRGETLGEIKYQDGSTLRIGAGVEDISGIYGGTLVEEITIHDIKVQIKKYEEINYATWTNKNYSYSYIKSDKENIKEIVTKIIERMD